MAGSSEKTVWCHQASNRYSGEKHRRKHRVGWVKTTFFVYDQSNALKRKCDENKADLRVCFCKNIWKDKTGKLDI